MTTSLGCCLLRGGSFKSPSSCPVACFLLCQLQRWVDIGEGAGIRAQAIPSPLRGPETGDGVSSAGGASGEQGCPCPAPRRGDFFLFVLSSSFFKKHKHMAAAGAGAVFGWCVRSPFAWLSIFSSPAPAPSWYAGEGDLSQRCSPSIRKIPALSSGGSGVPNGEGIRERFGKPRPVYPDAEDVDQDL